MATEHQTSAAAFAHAKHRAKYAHRDCVVWESANGWSAADYGRDAVKAALLATGTAGKFAVVSATRTTRMGWRLGVRALRNASVGAA